MYGHTPRRRVRKEPGLPARLLSAPGGTHIKKKKYRKEIFILLDFEGPVDRIRTSTVRALRPGYRHVSTMMFCLSGKSSRCVWGGIHIPPPPPLSSLGRRRLGKEETGETKKTLAGACVCTCVCVCAAVSERVSGRCGGGCGFPLRAGHFSLLFSLVTRFTRFTLIPAFVE